MLNTITVTVKLFAIYQETYRLDELKWDFPPGTSVESVILRCIQEHPHLSQWKEITRFAINMDFVSPDTVMQDGDEIVLIPPVSGG